MKRTLCAAVVLAAVAALVGHATAAKSSGPILVRLGKHVFGHTRAGVRVVDARWGIEPGAVGYLANSPGPNGGSAFDVVNGVVCLLDQNNSRVLVFAPGKVPRSLPLRVGQALRGGTAPDLAVGTDGTIYVLDDHGTGSSGPLWSFPASGGRPLAKVLTLGEAVRSNGTAAIVEGPAYGRWRQLLDGGRRAAGPWLPYRPFSDGARLIARPDEPHGVVRLTLSRPGGASTTWVVSTPPAVVDDTDVVGSNAVLVLGFGSQTAQEEQVLVLGPKGLVRSFSTRVDQFAQPNSDGWLRVDGSSLYQLGSTRRNVFVDRYSLR